MTKSQMKFVAESYAKYFGRAADADTIKEYGLKENGKPEKTSEILKNIIADAKVEKTGLGTEDFVNNAFQNLFNRNADTIEMNKYSKVVEKGKDLPINSIVKSAAKTDKAVYNNKMAVAVKYAELGGTEPLELNKISKGNLINLNFLNTVTKAADLKAKVDALADKSGIPSSFDGKTFVLTTGVDAGKKFIGTNKDDQFIADNSVTGTVNASTADTLDGGKGTDTFELYDDASTAGNATTASSTTTGSLPTLKNIENVVIYDTTIATASTSAIVDLTKWDSVETLFLVRDANEKGYKLGEKVTTVNLVDVKVDQILNFDDALTAATVGVNKVGTAATDTVTVDGTALKTLTINASGKASNFTLDQAADTIETLNITGKADLTLATTLATIKTVDGSKAEGKLVLSKLATMTSVKTGSGNDTVTLAAAASGDTINLGAGNDKLVKGAGTVAAGSIIDGGAGIDSLSAALVTAGNAGVFASFETLSITATAADLDLALLNKSTFTTIAIDGASTSTVRNVSTSQSLAVNATGTSTTLLFKDVAGTADAYKINFNADNAAANFNAGIVSVEKIETVIVNSVGKTGADNTIALKDADAKSLVITGDKDLTVTFNTAFGTASSPTNGLGVSTIDASASTAGITITNLGTGSTLNIADAGLTIKGGAGVDKITTGITTAKALTIETGAGNDTIDTAGATGKVIVNAGAGDDTLTVGAVGGTFTLGAGNDKIDVSLATAGTTPATAITEAAAKKTIITDASKGDIIKGLNTALLSKIVLTTEANIDAALATATGTASTNTWFQYAGDTYIVKGDANTGFTEGDTLVKLNGLVDLGNSTISAGDLTIA